MFKQTLFLSALFIVSLFATCPSNYPYTPRNGVFGGAEWEFWCGDWQLTQPGNGAVSFKATGNDLYVGLFDTPNTKTFKYALIIAGWSNSLIKLYKNGDFNNAITSVSFSVPIPDVPNSWSVQFNSTAKSIKVVFNGAVVFTYVDSNYGTQAANAKYISLSQYSSNVVLYNDCPTYPYQPRNGVFTGSYWEYYCPDWSLSQPGNGNVSFFATGNDVYVGLFDQVNTKTFKYAIIFSGWSNTQVKLYKNGDFNTAIASANFQIPNVNIPNSFNFVFNKNQKTISVYFNDQLAFNFVDSNYLTQAGSAQLISISQYSSNVVLYKNCPDYPYNARNGVFTGSYWEYFCNDWKLPTNGSGTISFQAKGNDLYVGLFDSPNTKTFKYAIIFAGWSNSAVALYKNGDFNTQLLTMKATVPDLTVYNNYTVGFSANKSVVAMYMNGNLVFAYGDTTFNAPNARWVSLSQYSSNVWFQNIKVGTTCAVKSFIELSDHFSAHANSFAQIEGRCPADDDAKSPNGGKNSDSLLIQNKLNKK